VAAHQEVPWRKVKKLPQLSDVKKQAGRTTHSFLAAHQVKPFEQMQFPQPSWVVGQLAGIWKHFFCAWQYEKPDWTVRQFPQESLVRQQAGTVTQADVSEHQVWPVGQIHLPQPSLLLGHSVGTFWQDMVKLHQFQPFTNVRQFPQPSFV